MTYIIEKIRAILNLKEGEMVFIDHMITILIAFALTRILILLTRTIFNKKLLDKLGINDKYYKTKTILSIFQSFINIVIYFIAITLVLNSFGINTSSIVAVAGVGGIAIAFAAQSLVKDLIIGAFILFEDQFNVDDLVNIGGNVGTVVSMGLRTTRLKDVDGAVYVIPNGSISTVINYSKSKMRVTGRIFVDKNIPYEKSKEILERAMEELSKEVSYFVKNPEILGIEGQTDFSYKVLIAGQVLNGKQWEASRRINEKSLEYLNKYKVEKNE